MRWTLHRVGQRQRPRENPQAAPAPDADFAARLLAAIDRAAEHQPVAPGIDHDLHRRIGLQHEAQRDAGRPAPSSAPAGSECWPRPPGCSSNTCAGRGHRARHLQEAAHPAVGQVDLLFAKVECPSPVCTSKPDGIDASAWSRDRSGFSGIRRRARGCSRCWWCRTPSRPGFSEYIVVARLAARSSIRRG